MIERTFCILKPDCFEKKVVGAILSRIEREGFTLVRGRLERLVGWDEFYAEHRGKPFFDDLCAFMGSGPTMMLVLEREDAVAHWRKVIGPTDPRVASLSDEATRTIDKLGSLRGRFGNMSGIIYRNCVHGSDSVEAAQREMRLFGLS